MARRTLFTDGFAGTGADLGAEWDRYSGVNGLQRVSDQVQAEVINAAVDCIESHSGSLPNDQWAEAVLAAMGPAASEYNAVAVGCRWAAPDTLSGYLLLIDIETSANIYRASLQKYTAGVLSTVQTFVTRTLAGNDVFRLEVIGATLTGFQNNAQIITGTDSAFAGGRAALEAYPTVTLANAVLASFASGDFGAAEDTVRVQLADLAMLSDLLRTADSVPLRLGEAAATAEIMEPALFRAIRVAGAP